MELYTEYRNGKPFAYRYGKSWEAIRLAMEGGYDTVDEAIDAYERETGNHVDRTVIYKSVNIKET